MKVKELMTTEVITLGPDDDLGLAERLMGDSRIRHLPVVDENFQLVGLITQRDLLKASLSSLHGMDPTADSRIKSAVPIHQVMTPTVATCTPDDPLQDVCDTLRHEKYGCMPVVADGKLVGIVTDSDFLRLASLFLSRYDGEALGKELVHDAMAHSTPPVADPS